jgi:hypothetical protein
MCAALLLLVLAALSGCGARSSGIVATVGASAITRAVLDHWTAVRAAAAGQTPAPGVVRRQALGFLISSQWTIAEARELGVSVSWAQAERQLERFRYAQVERLGYERFHEEARLRASLASARETRSDQVWLMRLNMLDAGIEAERVAQLRGQVTPAQVAAYYREHKRRFLVPERRDIQIIMTYDKAKTERARREVLAGRDFLTVARRVGVDPAAPDGIEHLYRGQGERILLEHVFAARPHVVEGPFKQALDYYVLKVTNVTTAAYRTLAQARPSIVRLLAARRFRRSAAARAAALETKWKARTSCRPGYVVAECGQ